MTDRPYISQEQCCGCGACAASCPKKAINMVKEEAGHLYPHIDMSKCISCNMCREVCFYRKLNKADDSVASHKAYVAASKDMQLISESASGGIFAALAKKVIESGGIVYGAGFCSEKDDLTVKHIGVERIEDLHILQGSKYVQSETTHFFADILTELKKNRTVLFSGTSCQVAALKSYLNRYFPGQPANLLTVDLICHGVPSRQLLGKYIEFIENKYSGKVAEYRFRRRDRAVKYTFTFTFTNGKIIEIPMRDSSYYRLFMSALGYRKSCYACPYANIDKPADITLGDFLISQDSLSKMHINRADFESRYLSCIMTHSDRGEWGLSKIMDDCIVKEIPIDCAIEKHEQLQHPSIKRNPALWELYLRGGFEAVEKKIRAGNAIRYLPMRLKNLFFENDL